MSGSNWRIFELATELAKHAESAVPYHEFLRVPSLSCGIYTLEAGATDLQAPHDEDEVYYVVRGRARLRVGSEERSVGPGSILYVGATSDHSFFEIEEDMTLLVFFATGGPG
jgi:mannose-6-phosphate isomerase-like protein (cupin superfamily)